LKFTSIDAGERHTCALTADGTAYCWGLNNRGQLGDGTPSSRSVPAAVSGGLRFQQIAAGGYFSGHTCALTTAGAVYCWGVNDQGQLGINTSDVLAHSTPEAVVGGLNFTKIWSGLGSHNCGLTSAQIAFCWGANDFGALGDGTTVDRATPVVVGGGITFAHLSAGGFIGHTCGIAANGAAYCWGDNEVGALGSGTTIVRPSPFPVAGALVFKSIDSGYRHTCAITTGGVLYCWGSNRSAQLGIGSTEQQLAPARVLGQP
jgi:alpha-tubulin suppressor-like RCC1 family protein